MAGKIERVAPFILLIIISLGATPFESALCKRVIDGDTIELSTGERVRYIGMDTLEPKGKLGNVIAEFNRFLVEGKEIRLEFDAEKYDKYNRLLAYVYVDDIFVNAMLVKRGLAKVMTVPPNVRYKKDFQQLEEEAKAANRGIWAK
ncbi:MAG: thermonuclease family protein [Candidatus Brocadiales bacterium]